MQQGRYGLHSIPRKQENRTILCGIIIILGATTKMHSAKENIEHKLFFFFSLIN